jgi:hypothetical protein
LGDLQAAAQGVVAASVDNLWRLGSDSPIPLIIQQKLISSSISLITRKKLASGGCALYNSIHGQPDKKRRKPFGIPDMF